MVGLSHVALRETVRAYLPRGARTVLFTEMLSTRRLPTEAIGTRTETAFAPSENNLVPQILGNEEGFIVRSLARLAAFDPLAVDFNLGCPVGQAIKHKWGVALMGDPAAAEALLRATVQAAPWPVSAKIRTGLSDDVEFLIDFARMLEAAGVAWITLHPRTAGQQRRGAARWEYIARVRDAVRIPVIGNGNVQTADDARRMLRETGCDGVMIGRAAAARPWIFAQIAEDLGYGSAPSCRAHDGDGVPRDALAEGREFATALGRLLDVAERHFAVEDALDRLRFHVSWGGRWLDFGHELGKRLGRVPSLAEARQVIADFFRSPQRMSPRTSLH